MNNRNVSKKREKIHAFMFKVLKCNYIFESTDRFICEHIHIDLLKGVLMQI